MTSVVLSQLWSKKTLKPRLLKIIEGPRRKQTEHLCLEDCGADSPSTTPWLAKTEKKTILISLRVWYLANSLITNSCMYLTPKERPGVIWQAGRLYMASSGFLGTSYAGAFTEELSSLIVLRDHWQPNPDTIKDQSLQHRPQDSSPNTSRKIHWKENACPWFQGHQNNQGSWVTFTIFICFT